MIPLLPLVHVSAIKTNKSIVLNKHITLTGIKSSIQIIPVSEFSIFRSKYEPEDRP